MPFKEAEPRYFVKQSIKCNTFGRQGPFPETEAGYIPAAIKENYAIENNKNSILHSEKKLVRSGYKKG